MCSGGAIARPRSPAWSTRARCRRRTRGDWCFREPRGRMKPREIVEGRASRSEFILDEASVPPDVIGGSYARRPGGPRVRRRIAGI